MYTMDDLSILQLKINHKKKIEKITPLVYRMDKQLTGLSQQEVLERRAKGLGNRSPIRTSRSYFQIIRENVFTFVNCILFGLGIALVLLGRPSDAFVSVLVILANLIVGVVQEIRSKLTLDRIALLTRPKAAALREGVELSIDPDEIVVGDLLCVRPGDQIVVDGQVIDGHMEVDESLLTGESDMIPKDEGDPVYSGSFCATGQAAYEAQKVGKDSLAYQMTSSARAFRRVLTPLQQQVNVVIRVILLVAVYLEGLMAVNSILEKTLLVESVKMSVVIIGLVPNGLFLAMAAAYAMGAVRIAAKGVLVQQSNAIESLSHIDVLCLDKTGTITTNNLRFHSLQPSGISQEDFSRILGHFAASVSAGNRTIAALAQAFTGEKLPVVAEVPFSSARKFSALAFNHPDLQGTYVLGALDVLRNAINQPGNLPDQNGEAAGLPELEAQALAAADQGLRVLLLATLPKPAPLMDPDGNICLPDGLIPLGLVCLSDELRPEAGSALRSFYQSGVKLKLISGDHPRTVSALVSQVGFPMEPKLYSGEDLSRMLPAEFSRAAETGNVFGRITPEQKERIIQSLRDNGHYVAMIGDGVNDVLSLKRANLGIAIQAGSQAARSVADLILLHDSFASLMPSVAEGRRIINGMQDILKLFLVRVFTVSLLILSVGTLDIFPYAPKHITVYTLFTVGLPTIALAAWARPEFVPRESIMRKLWHFVLPSTITMVIAGVAVAVLYANFGSILVPLGGGSFHDPASSSQTALTHFTLLCGLFLIVFVEPPTPFWTGGDVLGGDRRPAWMALILLGIYIAILAVPSFRQFFDLVDLGAVNFLGLGILAVLWAFLLRWIWRARTVERFFGTELMPV